jgi:hypothetical protein
MQLPVRGAELPTLYGKARSGGEVNIFAGMVSIYIGRDVAYTLHFKDFPTSVRFCRDFKHFEDDAEKRIARTESEQ